MRVLLDCNTSSSGLLTSLEPVNRLGKDPSTTTLQTAQVGDPFEFRRFSGRTKIMFVILTPNIWLQHHIYLYFQAMINMRQ